MMSFCGECFLTNYEGLFAAGLLGYFWGGYFWPGCGIGCMYGFLPLSVLSLTFMRPPLKAIL